MKWNKIIKIKHLFTEEEDYESVQKSMNLVAIELKKHSEFEEYDFFDWHNIPSDNQELSPLEAANELIDEMYDIADVCKIWIE